MTMKNITEDVRRKLSRDININILTNLSNKGAFIFTSISPKDSEITTLRSVLQRRLVTIHSTLLDHQSTIEVLRMMQDRLKF